MREGGREEKQRVNEGSWREERKSNEACKKEKERGRGRERERGQIASR